ncbi:TetR family transcriptional regulator [Sphingobium estronivorans]|uniref:TetR family transcriptional regulator n=1 Tax=Sphingobium estronivorans TaxID=1577690 RepID=UPI0023DDD0E5|nr:TetR family transcriptional regulator [Sphingobium estronivorans]
MEETRKLIAEQGIAALSMNEIGQRAGVAMIQHNLERMIPARRHCPPSSNLVVAGMIRAYP